MVPDVFVHSSAEIGMFIKIDGCLLNGGYEKYSFTLWQGTINSLSNGGYWLTVY